MNLKIDQQKVMNLKERKKNQKGKRWQSDRNLWDNIKMSNIWVIGVPEGEERENGTEYTYTYIFKSLRGGSS